jgi:intracellular multiplication protein IcmP
MSGSNSNADVFASLIMLILALVFGSYLVWHFGKVPILEMLRYLRYSELWVVNLFTHSHEHCLAWLQNTQQNDHNPSNEVITLTNQCFGPNFLSSVPKQELGEYFMLSATSMAVLATGIEHYIHCPMAIIFSILGMYVLLYSPRGKFRTRHTLESFIKVQAKIWPVIAPIVNFNPTKSSARMPGAIVPDKLPLFAEALSPEEWIAWHRIPVTNGIADREATRRAFVMQLGPRWNGLEGQPEHIKALFVAFSLKGVQKREQSDDLLGRISLCWSANKGFHLTKELADEIRGLLKDPEIGGKGLEVGQDYAWRSTALLAILKWARSMGGVLAPAQFLWLRGTDRNLWYVLNNLGRRSFHSEGAGAMAHFMVEQTAKKPLPIPRVDTAIVTLNQYLAETGRIIPQREDPNAKRGRK